jgi:hypothetical protein
MVLPGHQSNPRTSLFLAIYALLKALCVQRYLSDIRGARGDPKNQPQSVVDQEPTGERSDRPKRDLQ